MTIFLYLLLLVTPLHSAWGGKSVWIFPNESKTDLQLTVVDEGGNPLGALDLETHLPQSTISSEDLCRPAFMERLNTDIIQFSSIVNFLIHFEVLDALYELINEIHNASPSYVMRLNLREALNTILNLLNQPKYASERPTLHPLFHTLYERMKTDNSALLRQAEDYYTRQKFKDALLSLSCVHMANLKLYQRAQYHELRLLCFIQLKRNMEALHEATQILAKPLSFPQGILWVSRFITFEYGNLSPADHASLLMQLSQQAKTAAQHLKIAKTFEKRDNHIGAAIHYSKALPYLRKVPPPLIPPSPITQCLLRALKNAVYALTYSASSSADTAWLHSSIQAIQNDLNDNPKTPQEQKAYLQFKALYFNICTGQ